MPGLGKKGFLYSNDEVGKYPDSYYHASANTIPEFPRQFGEETADVCIVGAGYTGLSAALHLAQAGYKVILLDAHRVGWGASGRNGGQLASDQRSDQDTLESRYGKDHARALWDIGLEANQLCKDLIHEHAIDCDLTPGIIHADHRKRYLKHSRDYVEKLQTEYGYEDIRYLEQDEIRQLVGSESYFGGMLDTRAAHIHPLNFALGLADAAHEAGAVIYQESPVLSYSDGSGAGGSTVTVKLENGTITTKQLLLACNGYLDTLDKKVEARVMPINNYIVATEPLSESLASELLSENHAVADSRFVVNYFRLSADRRMLFGGGENYSFKFPKDIPGFVRKHMLQVYPQLEEARIDYGWGGTLAITVSRMPYFAKSSEGVVSASGYSGHGVAMATLAGKIMADMVDGKLARFDTMAGLKTYPFPGGAGLRWPLLALAMTYYGMRDRL
ncbi:NAD(P)/FAD-dependent oxidoreductase [Leucothrix pacifica]|uniref:FAD-dependent oxidoreductase n=1 Tax=Leucothrix pacifica TaxID=1247513 RepID=A0A317C3E1_9GAMM|nr:FAD-binding oxidoreductase [Leucothrix pacifica]PWQ92817.1 FAD-dependent oxidoreductase [Leucothrix pacifica]